MGGHIALPRVEFSTLDHTLSTVVAGCSNVLAGIQFITDLYPTQPPDTTLLGILRPRA